MRLRNVVAVVLITLAPCVVFAQAGASVSGPNGNTKIAVIDIERIAAVSEAGKAMMELLRAENDKLQAQSASFQQEINDMQAKLNSEILSQEARVRLNRDIERKRTDAQRWLEDAQADFAEKQQDSEAKFQAQLAPIVNEVATANGIGLIFRATPGLTFILDASLDISQLVVEKLDSEPSGGGKQ